MSGRNFIDRISCEIDSTMIGGLVIEKWKKKFANIKNKMFASHVPVTRSGTE